MNQALSRLAKQTFGNLIQLEREKQGLSHRDIAVRCGVDRDVAKAWERDEIIPSRFEMKKLFGSLQRMKHYVHLLPKEQQDTFAHDEAMPEQLAPIAPPSPSPPKTFGEALRRFRLHEGIGQDELGDLIKVTGQAVSAWETDRYVPILDHYNALIELFPDLKNAPDPKTDIRDIEKPYPGEKVLFNADIPHIETAPAPNADIFDTGTLALSLEPATKEKKNMQRPVPTPVSPPPSVPIIRQQPKPEAVKDTMSDMKYALIRWGRLVHSLKSREDAYVFTDFLAEANDAGMTLKDVIEALEEPK